MNRFQIENLYKANGLVNFRLRNTDDILKTHGIDIKSVKGYEKLDDKNRQLYEKFIVNIFNAWGLDSRSTLIPKGIYYVEETQLIAKENPEDNDFIGVGFLLKTIDKDGKKIPFRKWIHKSYKGLDIKNGVSSIYLRIEYEHQKRKEWLHITNENSWY